MDIELIKQAALDAGKIVLSANDVERSTQNKGEEGEGNFVTKYDVAVQNFLREKLLAAVPGAHFMGEENGQQDNPLHGLCFIVDPIDGTANFVRSMNCSAISIALAEDGELIAGVVYEPYRGELFWAEKGKGAFCNGRPIHVSNRPMNDGLFYFGTTPFLSELHDKVFALARALFDRMLDLRRFSPAAFELSNIACGRLEIGFEFNLYPWDYAAAACIIREAGGIITRLDGSPIELDKNGTILAGNPICYQEFFEQGLNKICE